jgi:hypothetical protein
MAKPDAHPPRIYDERGSAALSGLHPELLLVLRNQILSKERIHDSFLP